MTERTLASGDLLALGRLSGSPQTCVGRSGRDRQAGGGARQRRLGVTDYRVGLLRCGVFPMSSLFGLPGVGFEVGCDSGVWRAEERGGHVVGIGPTLDSGADDRGEHPRRVG